MNRIAFPVLLAVFSVLLPPNRFSMAFSASQSAAQSPTTLRLEDGTPIKLRLTRNMSSADAKVGETVDFEVLEEVKVGNVVVIPKGNIAWGTVTEAQPKRRMGRGGKLNVNIDSVRMANGEKTALRAVKEGLGGGSTGGMVGGIVVTSIIFFPAAPLFLFMKGKDITIPKGTEITTYINGDANLDPAKFLGAAPAPAPTPAATGPSAGASVVVKSTAEESSVVIRPPTEQSSIVIKSAPDGAEITVNGKYVGSTPSLLHLLPGDHDIEISKSGFRPWKRSLTVTASGTVTEDATLERNQ